MKLRIAALLAAALFPLNAFASLELKVTGTGGEG